MKTDEGWEHTNNLVNLGKDDVSTATVRTRDHLHELKGFDQAQRADPDAELRHCHTRIEWLLRTAQLGELESTTSSCSGLNPFDTGSCETRRAREEVQHLVSTACIKPTQYQQSAKLLGAYRRRCLKEIVAFICCRWHRP